MRFCIFGAFVRDDYIVSTRHDVRDYTTVPSGAMLRTSPFVVGIVSSAPAEGAGVRSVSIQPEHFARPRIDEHERRRPARSRRARTARRRPRAGSTRGTRRRRAGRRSARPPSPASRGTTRTLPWNDCSSISAIVDGTVLKFSMPPPPVWMCRFAYECPLTHDVEVREDVGRVVADARGRRIERVRAVVVAPARHLGDHVLRRREERRVAAEADLAARVDVLDADRVAAVPVEPDLGVAEDGLAVLRERRERREVREAVLPDRALLGVEAQRGGDVDRRPARGSARARAT